MLSSIFFSIIEIFIILIPLLLCVAILTLIERKVLASIQIRQGPSIVGYFGLLQPFADGLKLLIKEIVIPTFSNYYLFFFAPIISLFLSFMLWIVIPFSQGYTLVDLNLALLYVLGISSLSVYGIIIAGWSSNSKYAFFGSLRSAAQMISYEVSLGFILIPILVYCESFNFLDIIQNQKIKGLFIFIFLPLFFLFFVSALAETNRSPFDLPEAEAELVSGYNVEYSGFGFAFFFIAEYLNIIFMSFVIVILFFGGSLFFKFDFIFIFILKLYFILWLFIGVRAIVPRYRYDQLMLIGWKNFLPISLFLFFFYICFFISSLIFF